MSFLSKVQNLSTELSADKKEANVRSDVKEVSLELLCEMQSIHVLYNVRHTHNSLIQV